MDQLVVKIKQNHVLWVSRKCVLHISGHCYSQTQMKDIQNHYIWLEYFNDYAVSTI